MSPGLDLGLWRSRRVRLIRQTEVAECGLACLAMVSAYHGYDADLASLRREFQPSLRGASLKNLIKVADQMKLATRAIKVSLDQLNKLHLPAILHWDLNHYVVLERIHQGRLLIHDPAGRSHWLTLSSVSDHFTGIALELRPAEDFSTGTEKQRLKISQLWHRMSGVKRALIQTLILSLVMHSFVLASPYYMQIAVDNVLPATDRDLLTVIAIGFTFFTLINAGAELLRSFVLLSAGTSLGFGIASNIGRKLLRLPIGWFEKRYVGDILSRFQSVGPIRTFLTEGAVASVIDGTLVILTFVVMLFYNPTLAFVAGLGFLLYALVRILSFRAQRSAQEDVIIATGREQSNMIETLRGITTLRLFNRESTRHAGWQSKLTDSMNATVSLTRVTAWQSVSSSLIFGLETIASIWIGINLVLDGGFSVGMLFAFLAYKLQFTQRGISFLDQFIKFRMLNLHLERLADIALTQQDVGFDAVSGGATRSFKGDLELRQIYFRYSPSEPLVLNGVNLRVAAGEHVAITGPSGGGKTTLMKLMLGLAEPQSGEVLIDQVPMTQFGRKHFHDQVGTVLQEDSLFAGSLADNIALFDDSPSHEEIVGAAKLASIHSDIVSLPMGYETLVGDMGSTLSGGQKQRILLARALYRKPRLLIMDEGTSHLDPDCESAVNRAIAQLGITRIVIAHRRESILAADRVLKLARDGLSDVTDSIRG